MANLLYPAFKRSVMKGQINIDSTVVSPVPVVIKMGLFKTTASYDATTSDISTLVGSSDKISEATITNNVVINTETSPSANAVFDCDDVTFTAVSGASAVAKIIIWAEVGATKLPLVYIDSASGLPFTPTGGNIVVNISNSNNRLFSL